MLKRAVVFAFWCFLNGMHAICPDTDADLKPWSDAKTWNDNRLSVPSSSSAVTIKQGMKVKLDVNIDVKSITIETDGVLVWDSNRDSVVRTHFIYIQGTMAIGAEDCLIQKKVDILLRGMRYENPGIPTCGQKSICVGDGGTLELHGRDKLSWTKLTKTLPKPTPSDFFFKHLKSDKNKNEWMEGLRIYEFDANTMKVHKEKMFCLSGQCWWTNSGFTDIGPFINTVPNGRVIGVALQRKLKGSKNLDGVYAVLELIGAKRIREVDHDDVYALVTIKGDPSSTVEDIDRTSGDRKRARVTMVTTLNSGSKQKIEVLSQVKNGDWFGTFLDFTVYPFNTGFPRLDLVDNVESWDAGDKVLLTSTDFDMNQAEIGIVAECNDCGPKQIRVDLYREFGHWAELRNGIDYRGEVALLTRNIRIHGEIQPNCPSENGNCHKFKYDTFGGHVKVNRYFKNVHLEGVELENMGQQTSLGNYPLHFHMCHDTDDENYPNPPYLRKNSIHHTFARCITIHGSHGVTVQDNVCYDHLGHGIFLEDGGEKRTLIDGNLVAVTRKGDLIPTDRDFPSSFWITNPKTRLRNNIAAGSEGTGIWIIFPHEPTGPSRGLGFMARDEARHTKFTEITNNLAHSSLFAGFFFDGRIEDNLVRQQHVTNGYFPRTMPRDPKNKDARDDPVYINKLTYRKDEKEKSTQQITGNNCKRNRGQIWHHQATGGNVINPQGWKNRIQNSWINGGLFIMKHYSSADSARGLTFPSSSDQEQWISHSVFAGETANIGEPTWTWNHQLKRREWYPRSLVMPWSPKEPIQGFIYYDNPTYADKMWFTDFGATDNYTSGAFGFKRQNEFWSAVVSSATDIKFGFDDPSEGNRVYDGDKNVPGFSDHDGDLTATFRDKDGSVTSLSTFEQIVKPGRYETTSACQLRGNWDMAFCPYKYAKMWVSINNGVGGWPGNTRPFMVRDDEPDHPEHIAKGNMAQFMAILGGSHSYTLHWTKEIPREFWIWGQGVEKNQFVRIGVCLPVNADFELFTWSPQWRPTRGMWKKKSSIQELDADQIGDAYYWDTSNGMLFMKFINYKERTTSTSKLCEGHCPVVRITVKSGDRRKGDCRHRAYVSPGLYKRPSTGIMGNDDRSLPMTSAAAPAGWGAGSQLPFL
ncbi:TEME2 [Mytilus coruscus]|uniref:TEME2 n=1 Tax=Mytilus coruscus TaxID=42192 RepID=A0A6J8ECP4_MYTCO|nr:unnamed protein product [Mytilus coruscus]CAC5418260.1 TEME2 [Mytilus coruscus]